MRMFVVLVGVSGSGKTTIGELLADRMEVIFADADGYHSVANKAKMAVGSPLPDDDRERWLETLNTLLLGYYESRSSAVFACSALKAAYRTILTRGLPSECVAGCQ
jgi:gluconokinase